MLPKWLWATEPYLGTKHIERESEIWEGWSWDYDQNLGDYNMFTKRQTYHFLWASCSKPHHFPDCVLSYCIVSEKLHNLLGRDECNAVRNRRTHHWHLSWETAQEGRTWEVWQLSCDNHILGESQIRAEPLASQCPRVWLSYDNHLKDVFFAQLTHISMKISYQDELQYTHI